jgi:choline dehydrogenase-like flavoprotein
VVVLLDAVALHPHPDTQALYEGLVVGLPYDALETVRMRYFGGTTNMWTGWCRPLDPVDLRERPWLPRSGWPFGLEALEPYYRRAHPVLDLGEYRYDESWWAESGDALPPLDRTQVIPTFWRETPRFNMGQAYRAELQAAANITVLLHANVTGIHADPSASVVTHLTLATMEGKTATVRAHAFVLACGGIENARLLLASNDVEPHGLGNRHDLVGRFFMEHPYCRVGEIATGDPYALLDILGRRRQAGRRQRAGLTVSEAWQEKLGCANNAALISLDDDPDAPAAVAARLGRRLARLEWPDDLAGQAWRVLRNLDDLAVSVWRREVQGKTIATIPKRLALTVALDPVPTPDSRVTLADERDALGMQRTQLDWRLAELDRGSMLGTAQTVAAELARLGLGRVRLHRWLAEPGAAWPLPTTVPAGEDGGPVWHWSWHHMGTTRMADDPRRGVVDVACRVHGIRNLYVAGSSVFPTSGFANPTLTIVALALRLADHLKLALAST